MTPIGLDDLPEEILLEIAAYLIHPDQYPSVQDPKLVPGMIRAEDPFARCKSPQGKDVMALSSCCKWMRKALFGKWLLQCLSISLCEEDLVMVEGLMKETRECVKYVIHPVVTAIPMLIGVPLSAGLYESSRETTPPRDPNVSSAIST
jgi:hypothetical protein